MKDKPSGTLKLHPLATLMTGILVAAGIAILLHPVLTLAAAGSEAPASPPEDSHLVVFAEPEDPYYALAETIARSEEAPLRHSLEEALAQQPTFVLWVTAPESLSDERFSEIGLVLREQEDSISLGILSGGTVEAAQALWQRKPACTGTHLSVVPREGHITIAQENRVSYSPLTKANLLSAIQQADYLAYQGHGTRSRWQFDESTDLTAEEIPALPPLVVSAGACQTFKIWSESSIALGFTDRGAAAYVGAVHSPLGYLIGEPKGFPLRYTWPDFPIGHAIQVQNHGLLQGFLDWPFYFLLGDPRLSFQEGPPYTLVNDQETGKTRTLTYSNAPAGIIPVHIPRGATYTFVEIPGVANAWEKDPLYNSSLQMADIGADKYLLFVHEGGDFTITLRHSPPWYRPVVNALTAALDHVTVIYHSENNNVLNLIAAGILTLSVGWMVSRNKQRVQAQLRDAGIAGLIFTLCRGGYALARRDYLIQRYASYLRTMDVGFDINPLFLISTFLLASSGAWLFLQTRSRWRRGLALIAGTFPGVSMLALWTGMETLTNALARQQYGITLYGHAGSLTALMMAVIESMGLLLILMALGRRRAHPDLQQD